MESRIEFTRWLKEREAVHVLGDVWFIAGCYPLAGDIQREVERFNDFAGRLIAIQLNETNDSTQKTFHKMPMLGYEQT
jgi:hypothetical protein